MTKTLPPIQTLPIHYVAYEFSHLILFEWEEHVPALLIDVGPASYALSTHEVKALIEYLDDDQFSIWIEDCGLIHAERLEKDLWVFTFATFQGSVTCALGTNQIEQFQDHLRTYLEDHELQGFPGMSGARRS